MNYQEEKVRKKMISITDKILLVFCVLYVIGSSVAYEMVNSKRYDFKLFENFALTKTLFTQEQIFVDNLLKLKSSFQNEINLTKKLLTTKEEHVIDLEVKIIKTSAQIRILKEQVFLLWFLI